MFEKQTGTWVFDAKLSAPLIGGVGGNFGSRIALQDDILAVAAYTAPLAGSWTGVVHVYEKLAGTWTHTAMLAASDATPGDLFGSALDIAGGRVIVGSPSKNGLAGAAYVFENTAGAWSQAAKLLPTDSQGGKGVRHRSRGFR